MPPLGVIDWATVKVAGYLSEHLGINERTDPTEEPAEVTKIFAKANAGAGSRITPWEAITYVQQAEGKALEILRDHWPEVESIAALAIASLPVGSAQLAEALQAVPQLENPCDGSR
jgi:hypothetical protein